MDDGEVGGQVPLPVPLAGRRRPCHRNRVYDLGRADPPSLRPEPSPALQERRQQLLQPREPPVGEQVLPSAGELEHGEPLPGGRQGDLDARPLRLQGEPVERVRRQRQEVRPLADRGEIGPAEQLDGNPPPEP